MFVVEHYGGTLQLLYWELLNNLTAPSLFLSGCPPPPLSLAPSLYSSCNLNEQPFQGVRPFKDQFEMIFFGKQSFFRFRFCRQNFNRLRWLSWCQLGLGEQLTGCLLVQSSCPALHNAVLPARAGTFSPACRAKRCTIGFGTIDDDPEFKSISE